MLSQKGTCYFIKHGFPFILQLEHYLFSNWMEVGYTMGAFHFMLAKGDFKIFAT